MPFASTDTFHAAFTAGLRPLLDHDSLGTFILVGANATFDPAIYPAMVSELQGRYQTLLARYRGTLAAGLPLNEVEEDLLVFLKIAAIGFDGLQPTETRRAGPWELQFNHLRSFRPKRISHQPPSGISAPFNEQGFHFNKPFLQKELFWRGELGGRSIDLYYNKYPFADLHTLLVPERERHSPQYLKHADHDYIWTLVDELAPALPGLGIGYNSYGAFASVNHLHFQFHVRDEALPVQHGRWTHNGGNEPYPARCEAFDQPAEAWRRIATLHQAAIPYSLIYTAGRAYIFPRQPQGSGPLPPWTSGFTWHDMAGAIVTFNRAAYLDLDEAAIAAELATVSRHDA